MKREIVIYKNCRGQEMICHAQEYDDLWGEMPSTQFVSRGWAELPDPGYVHAPKPEPPRAGAFIGRVRDNASIFRQEVFFDDAMADSQGIVVFNLPNNSQLLNVVNKLGKLIFFFRCDDIRDARVFAKRFYITERRFDALLGKVLDYTTVFFFDANEKRFFIFPIIENPERVT